MKVKACTLWFLFALPLGAADLKKVLILDIQNIEEIPEYAYLESSISDALTNKLKENFAFRETQRESWKNAAKKFNMPFEDEAYTRTYALNLGTQMKQNIAIGGGFRIASEKKSAHVKAQVFIIDVEKGVLISRIEKKMPLNADLFAKIEELASELSHEARRVLPSKEFYENNKDDFDVGTSYLRLSGELTFLTLAGPKAINDAAPYMSPSVAPLSTAAGLRYATSVFHNWDIWLQGSYHSGAMSVSTNSGMTIPHRFAAGSALAGGAYTFRITKRLMFAPFLGGGFLAGESSFDFSGLAKKAYNSNGTSITGGKFLFYGPTTTAGLDLTFNVAKDYFISVGIHASTFFNSESVSTILGSTIGSGWRF